MGSWNFPKWIKESIFPALFFFSATKQEGFTEATHLTLQNDQKQTLATLNCD